MNADFTCGTDTISCKVRVRGLVKKAVDGADDNAQDSTICFCDLQNKCKKQVMVMLKMHDFSLCNILVLGGMMQNSWWYDAKSR